MKSALGSETNPLIVAVIGSGPSGFYVAEALLKSGSSVQVNIVERLPVPYGLVRYGVAPDHPKLKQVSIVFQKIAEDPRVHFFGNVMLDRDVSLEDLKSTHHAVILCNGAESDRQLNIPGEDLPGSHTATEFVAWYNGHPDYKQAEFDLSQDTAVIIGQGNVAADVARILCKSVDELKSTDIASHALDQLAESRIRQVHIVGRRGPVQAKFTSKELRELGELGDCSTQCGDDGFLLSSADKTELAQKTNDNAAKCFELFKSFGHIADTVAAKHIHFHFLLSPVEMVGNGRLETIRFVRNQLTGAPMEQVSIPIGEMLDIDCGLCFRSIGYRGRPLSHIPFDDARGIIPNVAGRVVDAQHTTVPGLYVSGWIKRGPSGIIGTNKADSYETVESLVHDLPDINSGSDTNVNDFVDMLEKRNVSFIDFDQWRMIDSAEQQMGQQCGKIREKIISIDQMLAIAG